MVGSLPAETVAEAKAANSKTDGYIMWKKKNISVTQKTITLRSSDTEKIRKDLSP